MRECYADVRRSVQRRLIYHRIRYTRLVVFSSRHFFFEGLVCLCSKKGGLDLSFCLVLLLFGSSRLDEFQGSMSYFRVT